LQIVNSPLTKALFAVSFLLLASLGSSAQANLVLITIDTLRPDHLGCYGYTSIKTPNIDQLSRAGVRFTRAYTPVPITMPAHAALFTGAFPLATGIHDFSGNKLPTNAATIAQTLRDNHYSTAAFIGAAVLDSRFGLSRGFETYFDHFQFGRSEEIYLDSLERRGDRVVDEALNWLRGGPRGQFFLWVHLYDPHRPYNPPEPYASRYRTRPYDGEIAFADAQVGRLVALLRQLRLFDTSVMVLAGDHGESLGEHGEKTHGFFLYNATLHVPLIIRIPGVAPRVVGDEVSLVDVMPTILQALKIPVPSSVQGKSLLSLVRGGQAPDADLYAESYFPLLHFGWSPLRSLQWRGLKYVETSRPELYDTRTDPRELNDVLDTHQALAGEMRDRLHRLVRRFTPAGNDSAAANQPADHALTEALRSLGYVALSAGTITDAAGRTLPDPKDRIQVYESVSAAMVEGQHGRYEESLRRLREAEKTEHKSPTIHFLMARDYYRLNDFPQAARYFQSAFELNPKDSVAAYYLGLSRLELGDLDSAENSFRRALEIDPANFSAAFNLGVVYSRRRQTDAAIQAFQRAVTIFPEYADAHEALGELYLYLERPDDAVRELERAVAIAPGMRKAHYHLGRAYEAKGLQEKAVREFNRAKSP